MLQGKKLVGNLRWMKSNNLFCPKIKVMINGIDWAIGLGCAITVSAADGTILYMNEKSQKVFEKWGGEELIGQRLWGCHSEKSVETIKRLIENKESNCYTIEKNGVKKLIYQTPWFDGEELGGLVEISIELPASIPHHVR